MIHHNILYYLISYYIKLDKLFYIRYIIVYYVILNYIIMLINVILYYMSYYIIL